MNEASLSLYETTELFYIILEAQDRFFEFWITATFAVIIACHLGSSILTRSFSLMISFMYLAFSINLIGRWVFVAEAVSRYRNDMASQSGIQLNEQLIDLSRMLVNDNTTCWYYCHYILRLVYLQKPKGNLGKYK